MKRKIRTIFAGTPIFAVKSLEALLDDVRFEVVAIITAEDKKVGRKQILTAPPIKELALKNNIKVLQPAKIKDIKDDIIKINPDVVVVVSYGKIFRQEILDIPKYGFINVHGSILPKYRGAAVIQAPIINGDAESGVSIIKMDAGLDTGPILSIEKTPLTSAETAESLHDKLSKLGADILPDTIADYIDGYINPQEQEGESIYCPTIKKEDGKIDWSKDANYLERLSRAMSPWPGTFTQLRITNYLPAGRHDELRIIKIIKITEVIPNINNHKVGEIFLHNDKIAVQCGKGAVVIDKLQEEGKKPVGSKDFLNGHPNLIGKIFE